MVNGRFDFARMKGVAITGLSVQAAARVFGLPEATVRSWLTRAGLHSRSLHNRLIRSLHLTHLQLDELRLKLRGQAEAA